jgi:hypothetical protein
VFKGRRLRIALLTAGLALMGGHAALAAVQDGAIDATIGALHDRLGVPASSVRVSYVSIVGQWSFTSWSAGEGGGDSIIRRVHGTWNVLGQGQGEMNQVVLVHFGVPPEIADALRHGSCPKLLRVRRGSDNAPRSVFVRRLDRHGRHVDTTIHCQGS